VIPAQGHSVCVWGGGGASRSSPKPKRHGLARRGACATCCHRDQCAWDGAAAGGTLALRGRPGPLAKYCGPKGVLPGRLRRGGTHRFDATTVRWCGGSVRRCAAVSMPEKGSTPVMSQSCGEGRER
jgi:hypothetical protein